jgi:ubiquinone biosynthesis protein UbiJ
MNEEKNMESQQDNAAGVPQAEKKRGNLTAKEWLTEELPARAQRANERLRAQLLGRIRISLTDTNEQFLFDWSADSPKLMPATDSAADCSISISAANFLKIAAGELNAQIASLSNKVNIEGKASLAIYFFNLVAPRAVH